MAPFASQITSGNLLFLKALNVAELFGNNFWDGVLGKEKIGGNFFHRHLILKLQNDAVIIPTVGDGFVS